MATVLWVASLGRPCDCGAKTQTFSFDVMLLNWRKNYLIIVENKMPGVRRQAPSGNP